MSAKDPTTSTGSAGGSGRVSARTGQQRDAGDDVHEGQRQAREQRPSRHAPPVDPDAAERALELPRQGVRHAMPADPGRHAGDDDGERPRPRACAPTPSAGARHWPTTPARSRGRSRAPTAISTGQAVMTSYAMATNDAVAGTPQASMPASRAGSPPTRIGVSVEPASANALMRRLSEKVSRDPTPSVSHWSRKVRATRSAMTRARQMACAAGTERCIVRPGATRRNATRDRRSSASATRATDRATAGWFRSPGCSAMRITAVRRWLRQRHSATSTEHAGPERRPRTPAQCRRRDATSAREVDRRLILGERERRRRRCPAARPRA